MSWGARRAAIAATREKRQTGRTEKPERQSLHIVTICFAQKAQNARSLSPLFEIEFRPM
ncbi:protein of unknown function [Rhodovastum atsumiense]|nr:protein of unknown function [Rhodovastum atsumiense]